MRRIAFIMILILSLFFPVPCLLAEGETSVKEHAGQHMKEHGGKEHAGKEHKHHHHHLHKKDRAAIQEAAAQLKAANPELAAKLEAIAGKK